MPVLDQHASPRKVRHHRRRHQVARAVQAGIAGTRIELAQPAADRHVRTDDQHRVGETSIAAIRLLVQDRPGG
jgi:hypothetical protein